MPKRKKIYIEFKYPERPWVVFDETQVTRWADTQESRMKQEHPGAKYRRRVAA